jgi:2-dehydropantoate 2-reductase
MIRRVAIVGAGALGAVYGSILHNLKGTSVTFVAGDERAQRLSEKGVVVNGTDHFIPVTTPGDGKPHADLLVVAVKHHHLHDAVRVMAHQVGPQSAIISVMNGIESEGTLAAAFGSDKVLFAIAVGIDAVREKNRVTYRNQGRILFGEAENQVLSDRVRALRDLFTRAGIAHETPADMIRTLWWKFMINVGINQVSAAYRAPYGAFQAHGKARDLMESAMREVMLLAGKKGIALGEEDLEAWHRVLNSLDPRGKTSMLQDVEAGRKTEVEIFAGTVIKLGREFQVPTPVNDHLFRAISSMEAGRDVQRGPPA